MRDFGTVRVILVQRCTTVPHALTFAPSPQLTTPRRDRHPALEMHGKVHRIPDQLDPRVGILNRNRIPIEASREPASLHNTGSGREPGSDDGT